MKKIFISLLAVAALAACTKSEVALDDPAEITFAPAAKNVTKAALTGTYPEEQKLGVYANYSNDAPSANAEVANYTTAFLNNVLFSHNGSAWGAGESWPSNGSLIFAGYTIPESGTVSSSYEYDFTSDKLTVKDYIQSTVPAESFDLGWFNRTSASYNYRNTTNAVPVTISHALAWVEFQVKGEGTTIGANPWKINTMTINKVANTGSAVCIGAGAGKANWTPGTANQSIIVFSGEQPLTGTAALCETANTDVLVIPQTPTKVLTDETLDVEKSVATLTVSYTYNSPAGEEMPLQTTTVPLLVDGGWKSGYKYTYTLTFKASEILIAPVYDTWDNGTNGNVEVE